MKYIVCQIQRDGDPFLNVPFVFPETLVHSMVFSQMRALLEHQYFSDKKKTTVVCISAGFLSSTVLLTDGPDGLCHGESTSLGVKSRGADDDRLLMMNDYGSGAVV
jgi:hypothetical protein